MRILFLGDIVGRPGRNIVIDRLPSLISNEKIDLVICNAENSAHGKGITFRIYNQLISNGVDVITLGNHAFSKREIIEYLDECDALVTPVNHNIDEGKHYLLINCLGLNICVTNILGQILIGECAYSPFEAMEKVLNETKDLDVDLYFVDLHAEATAEKRLFVEYFKDEVDIVVGTHTHVQTADEQIIDDTAFISDVGMCGPYQSIIGRDIEETITSNIKNIKSHYTIAEGEAMLCAVVIDIDEVYKKPIAIKRIQIRPSNYNKTLA